MMNENLQLFPRLLYGLELDFAKTAIVWALLSRSADRDWVETSSKTMAEELGGLVTRTSVQRALESLVADGLVDRRIHPNYYTKYMVNTAALERLLARPLPEARILPGLGPDLLPWLRRVKESENAHE